MLKFDIFRNLILSIFIFIISFVILNQKISIYQIKINMVNTVKWHAEFDCLSSNDCILNITRKIQVKKIEIFLDIKFKNKIIEFKEKIIINKIYWKKN